LLGFQKQRPLNITATSTNGIRYFVHGAKPYATHFECFEVNSGRSSSGGLGAIKEGCTIDDPTFRLQALGYNSF